MGSNPARLDIPNIAHTSAIIGTASPEAKAIGIACIFKRLETLTKILRHQTTIGDKKQHGPMISESDCTIADKNIMSSQERL